MMFGVTKRNSANSGVFFAFFRILNIKCIFAAKFINSF
jgi:hypothetical protein